MKNTHLGHIALSEGHAVQLEVTEEGERRWLNIRHYRGAQDNLVPTRQGTTIPIRPGVSNREIEKVVFRLANLLGTAPSEESSKRVFHSILLRVFKNSK